MSRTRELRELFQRRARERAFDPALVAFADLVNEVIAGKGALSRIGEDWLRLLHDQAPVLPRDALRGWIEAQTATLFLSQGEPPRWPPQHGLDWCFHDAQPLTFVGQMPSPGAGESFFVFQGRRAAGADGGWRAFYKMKLVADAGETLLAGVIEG